MAVGDVVCSVSSISTAAQLNIQPGAGREWVIHNINYGGAMSIAQSDTTTSTLCTFDTDSAAGNRANLSYHCSTAFFYVIRNTSTLAYYAGYDGVVTK
jgi:hypothetical protein